MGGIGYNLPDPDAIDAYAAEWEGTAQVMDDLAVAVKTGANTPQWTGKAHRYFLESSHLVYQQVFDVAAQAWQTAQMLRKYADQVRKIIKQQTKDLIVFIISMVLGVLAFFPPLSTLIGAIGRLVSTLLAALGRILPDIAGVVMPFVSDMITGAIVGAGFVAVPEGIGTFITGVPFTVDPGTWALSIGLGAMGGLLLGGKNPGKGGSGPKFNPSTDESNLGPHGSGSGTLPPGKVPLPNNPKVDPTTGVGIDNHLNLGPGKTPGGGPVNVDPEVNVNVNPKPTANPGGGKAPNQNGFTTNEGGDHVNAGGTNGPQSGKAPGEGNHGPENVQLTNTGPHLNTTNGKPVGTRPNTPDANLGNPTGKGPKAGGGRSPGQFDNNGSGTGTATGGHNTPPSRQGSGTADTTTHHVNEPPLDRKGPPASSAGGGRSTVGGGGRTTGGEDTFTNHPTPRGDQKLPNPQDGAHGGQLRAQQGGNIPRSGAPDNQTVPPRTADGKPTDTAHPQLRVNTPVNHGPDETAHGNDTVTNPHNGFSRPPTPRADETTGGKLGPDQHGDLNPNLAGKGTPPQERGANAVNHDQVPPQSRASTPPPQERGGANGVNHDQAPPRSRSSTPPQDHIQNPSGSGPHEASAEPSPTSAGQRAHTPASSGAEPREGSPVPSRASAPTPRHAETATNGGPSLKPSDPPPNGKAPTGRASLPRLDTSVGGPRGEHDPSTVSPGGSPVESTFKVSPVTPHAEEAPHTPSGRTTLTPASLDKAPSTRPNAGGHSDAQPTGTPGMKEPGTIRTPGAERDSLPEASAASPRTSQGASGHGSPRPSASGSTTHSGVTGHGGRATVRQPPRTDPASSGPHDGGGAPPPAGNHPPDPDRLAPPNKFAGTQVTADDHMLSNQLKAGKFDDQVHVAKDDLTSQAAREARMVKNKSDVDQRFDKEFKSWSKDWRNVLSEGRLNWLRSEFRQHVEGIRQLKQLQAASKPSAASMFSKIKPVTRGTAMGRDRFGIPGAGERPPKLKDLARENQFDTWNAARWLKSTFDYHAGLDAAVARANHDFDVARAGFAKDHPDSAVSEGHVAQMKDQYLSEVARGYKTNFREGVNGRSTKAFDTWQQDLKGGLPNRFDREGELDTFMKNDVAPSMRQWKEGRGFDTDNPRSWEKRITEDLRNSLRAELTQEHLPGGTPRIKPGDGWRADAAGKLRSQFDSHENVAQQRLSDYHDIEHFEAYETGTGFDKVLGDLQRDFPERFGTMDKGLIARARADYLNRSRTSYLDARANSADHDAALTKWGGGKGLLDAKTADTLTLRVQRESGMRDGLDKPQFEEHPLPDDAVTWVSGQHGGDLQRAYDQVWGEHPGEFAKGPSEENLANGRWQQWQDHLEVANRTLTTRLQYEQDLNGALSQAGKDFLEIMGSAAAPKFAISDYARDMLANRFRENVGRMHHDIFGRPGEDVGGRLANEKLHTDAFGAALNGDTNLGDDPRPGEAGSEPGDVPPAALDSDPPAPPHGPDGDRPPGGDGAALSRGPDGNRPPAGVAEHSAGDGESGSVPSHAPEGDRPPAGDGESRPAAHDPEGDRPPGGDGESAPSHGSEGDRPPAGDGESGHVLDKDGQSGRPADDDALRNLRLSRFSAGKGDESAPPVEHPSPPDNPTGDRAAPTQSPRSKAIADAAMARRSDAIAAKVAQDAAKAGQQRAGVNPTKAQAAKVAQDAAEAARQRAAAVAQDAAKAAREQAGVDPAEEQAAAIAQDAAKAGQQRAGANPTKAQAAKVAQDAAEAARQRPSVAKDDGAPKPGEQSDLSWDLNLVVSKRNGLLEGLRGTRGPVEKAPDQPRASLDRDPQAAKAPDKPATSTDPTEGNPATDPHGGTDDPIWTGRSQMIDKVVSQRAGRPPGENKARTPASRRNPPATPRAAHPTPGRQLLRTDDQGNVDLVRVSAEPTFNGFGRRAGGEPKSGQEPFEPKPVDNHEYTELRPDGTMTPSTLRPDETVLSTQRATGTELRGNGYRNGDLVRNDPHDRFLTFDPKSKSWDVEAVGRGGEPVAPTNQETGPVQLLRRNPDGSIDLLTFGKPPARTVGEEGTQGEGAPTYHELDPAGSGGWHPETFGRGDEPSVERISVRPDLGARLDGRDLTWDREPTSLLVRDQYRQTWSPLAKTKGAWSAKDDPRSADSPPGFNAKPAVDDSVAGPVHYRWNPETKTVEPLKVQQNELDVAEVGADSGAVTFDKYTAGGGPGGARPTLKLRPDGTLSADNIPKIGASELRYDPDSGAITYGAPKPKSSGGGDKPGDKPGGGTGGGGMALKDASRGSETRTDDAITFTKQEPRTAQETAADRPPQEIDHDAEPDPRDGKSAADARKTTGEGPATRLGTSPESHASEPLHAETQTTGPLGSPKPNQRAEEALQEAHAAQAQQEAKYKEQWKAQQQLDAARSAAAKAKVAARGELGKPASTEPPLRPGPMPDGMTMQKVDTNVYVIFRGGAPASVVPFLRPPATGTLVLVDRSIDTAPPIDEFVQAIDPGRRAHLFVQFLGDMRQLDLARAQTIAEAVVGKLDAATSRRVVIYPRSSFGELPESLPESLSATEHPGFVALTYRPAGEALRAARFNRLSPGPGNAAEAAIQDHAGVPVQSPEAVTPYEEQLSPAEAAGNAALARQSQQQPPDTTPAAKDPDVPNPKAQQERQSRGEAAANAALARQSHQPQDATPAGKPQGAALAGKPQGATPGEKPQDAAPVAKGADTLGTTDKGTKPRLEQSERSKIIAEAASARQRKPETRPATQPAPTHQQQPPETVGATQVDLPETGPATQAEPRQPSETADTTQAEPRTQPETGPAAQAEPRQQSETADPSLADPSPADPTRQPESSTIRPATPRLTPRAGGRQLLRTDQFGNVDLVRVTAPPRFQGPGHRVGDEPAPVTETAPVGTRLVDSGLRYLELRGDGTMAPTVLRPGETVLEAKPASGTQYGDKGFRNGKPVPTDPRDRFVTFSPRSRSWDVQAVGKSDDAPASRTEEARPVQLLRKNPDGSIDLVTFTKPPASRTIGAAATQRPDAPSYHPLDPDHPGAWHPETFGYRDVPEVERISTPRQPGNRIDSVEVSWDRDPTSLLVRSQQSGTWGRLAETRGAWSAKGDPASADAPPGFSTDRPDGAPSASVHYRWNPESKAFEQVEVQPDALDVAEVSTQTGEVRFDTYQADGGPGGAEPTLGVRPDGSLATQNARKIGAGELSFDPETGAITYNGATKPKDDGGGGTDKPEAGGGGKGGGGLGLKDASRGASTQTDDTITFTKKPTPVEGQDTPSPDAPPEPETPPQQGLKDPDGSHGSTGLDDGVLPGHRLDPTRAPADENAPEGTGKTAAEARKTWTSQDGQTHLGEAPQTLPKASSKPNRLAQDALNKAWAKQAHQEADKKAQQKKDLAAAIKSQAALKAKAAEPPPPAPPLTQGPLPAGLTARKIDTNTYVIFNGGEPQSFIPFLRPPSDGILVLVDRSVSSLPDIHKVVSDIAPGRRSTISVHFLGKLRRMDADRAQALAEVVVGDLDAATRQAEVIITRASFAGRPELSDFVVPVSLDRSPAPPAPQEAYSVHPESRPARGIVDTRTGSDGTIDTLLRGTVIRSRGRDGFIFDRFDSAGRATRMISPAGHITTFRFGPNNVRLATSDGTESAYHDGKLVRRTTPDGLDFTRFGPQGQPLAGTTADGRPVTVEHGEGGVVTIHYPGRPPLETRLDNQRRPQHGLNLKGQKYSISYRQSRAIRVFDDGTQETVNAGTDRPAAPRWPIDFDVWHRYPLVWSNGTWTEKLSGSGALESQTAPDGTVYSEFYQGVPRAGRTTDGRRFTIELDGTVASYRFTSWVTLEFRDGELVNLGGSQRPSGERNPQLGFTPWLDDGTEWAPLSADGRQTAPDGTIYHDFSGGMPYRGTTTDGRGFAIRPDGAFVRYTFDQTGDLEVKTYEFIGGKLSKVTSVRFDETAGTTLRSTWDTRDLAGTPTVNVLRAGRRVETRNPLGWTESNFDELGRPRTLTYPDGRVVTLNRQGAGTVRTGSDGDEYAHLGGRLVRHTTTDGTDFTSFDPAGRPIAGRTGDGRPFTVEHGEGGAATLRFTNASTVDTRFDSAHRPAGGRDATGRGYTIEYRKGFAVRTYTDGERREVRPGDDRPGRAARYPVDFDVWHRSPRVWTGGRWTDTFTEKHRLNSQIAPDGTTYTEFVDGAPRQGRTPDGDAFTIEVTGPVATYRFGNGVSLEFRDGELVNLGGSRRSVLRGPGGEVGLANGAVVRYTTADGVDFTRFGGGVPAREGDQAGALLSLRDEAFAALWRAGRPTAGVTADGRGFTVTYAGNEATIRFEGDGGSVVTRLDELFRPLNGRTGDGRGYELRYEQGAAVRTFGDGQVQRVDAGSLRPAPDKRAGFTPWHDLGSRWFADDWTPLSDDGRQTAPDGTVYHDFSGGVPHRGTTKDGRGFTVRPDGAVVRYTFDQTRDLTVKVHEFIGGRPSDTYSTRFDEATGTTMRTTWDQQGRPTVDVYRAGKRVESRDPHGWTSSDFDAAGRARTLKNSNGRVTRISPRGADTVHSTRDGSQFGYVNDRLVRQTTPDGTDFTAFDPTGRPVLGSTADRRDVTVDYAADGTATIQYDGGGTVTTRLDGENRPLHGLAPDGRTYAIRYTGAGKAVRTFGDDSTVRVSPATDRPSTWPVDFDVWHQQPWRWSKGDWTEVYEEGHLVAYVAPDGTRYSSLVAGVPTRARTTNGRAVHIATDGRLSTYTFRDGARLTFSDGALVNLRDSPRTVRNEADGSQLGFVDGTLVRHTTTDGTDFTEFDDGVPGRPTGGRTADGRAFSMAYDTGGVATIQYHHDGATVQTRLDDQFRPLHGRTRDGHVYELRYDDGEAVRTFPDGTQERVGPGTGRRAGLDFMVWHRYGSQWSRVGEEWTSGYSQGRLVRQTAPDGTVYRDFVDGVPAQGTTGDGRWFTIHVDGASVRYTFQGETPGAYRVLEFTSGRLTRSSITRDAKFARPAFGTNRRGVSGLSAGTGTGKGGANAPGKPSKPGKGNVVTAAPVDQSGPERPSANPVLDDMLAQLRPKAATELAPPSDQSGPAGPSSNSKLDDLLAQLRPKKTTELGPPSDQSGPPRSSGKRIVDDLMAQLRAEDAATKAAEDAAFAALPRRDLPRPRPSTDEVVRRMLAQLAEQEATMRTPGQTATPMPSPAEATTPHATTPSGAEATDTAPQPVVTPRRPRPPRRTWVDVFDGPVPPGLGVAIRGNAATLYQGGAPTIALTDLPSGSRGALTIYLDPALAAALAQNPTAQAQVTDVLASVKPPLQRGLTVRFLPADERPALSPQEASDLATALLGGVEGTGAAVYLPHGGLTERVAQDEFTVPVDHLGGLGLGATAAGYRFHPRTRPAPSVAPLPGTAHGPQPATFVLPNGWVVDGRHPHAVVVDERLSDRAPAAEPTPAGLIVVGSAAQAVPPETMELVEQLRAATPHVQVDLRGGSRAPVASVPVVVLPVAEDSAAARYFTGLPQDVRATVVDGTDVVILHRGAAPSTTPSGFRVGGLSVFVERGVWVAAAEAALRELKPEHADRLTVQFLGDRKPISSDDAGRLADRVLSGVPGNAALYFPDGALTDRPTGNPHRIPVTAQGRPGFAVTAAGFRFHPSGREAPSVNPPLGFTRGPRPFTYRLPGGWYVDARDSDTLWVDDQLPDDVPPRRPHPAFAGLRTIAVGRPGSVIPPDVLADIARIRAAGGAERLRAAGGAERIRAAGGAERIRAAGGAERIGAAGDAGGDGAEVVLLGRALTANEQRQLDAVQAALPADLKAHPVWNGWVIGPVGTVPPQVGQSAKVPPLPGTKVLYLDGVDNDAVARTMAAVPDWMRPRLVTQPAPGVELTPEDAARLAAAGATVAIVPVAQLRGHPDADDTRFVPMAWSPTGPIRTLPQFADHFRVYPPGAVPAEPLPAGLADAGDGQFTLSLDGLPLDLTDPRVIRIGSGSTNPPVGVRPIEVPVDVTAPLSQAAMAQLYTLLETWRAGRPVHVRLNGLDDGWRELENAAVAASLPPGYRTRRLPAGHLIAPDDGEPVDLAQAQAVLPAPEGTLFWFSGDVPVGRILGGLPDSLRDRAVLHRDTEEPLPPDWLPSYLTSRVWPWTSRPTPVNAAARSQARAHAVVAARDLALHAVRVKAAVQVMTGRAPTVPEVASTVPAAAVHSTLRFSNLGHRDLADVHGAFADRDASDAGYRRVLTDAGLPVAPPPVRLGGAPGASLSQHAHAAVLEAIRLTLAGDVVRAQAVILANRPAMVDHDRLAATRLIRDVDQQRDGFTEDFAALAELVMTCNPQA